MNIPSRTLDRVWLRQGGAEFSRRGQGTASCAHCGRDIMFNYRDRDDIKGGWKARLRKPKTKGGTNKWENWVLLGTKSPNCYSLFDPNETIPDSELKYCP